MINLAWLCWLLCARGCAGYCALAAVLATVRSPGCAGYCALAWLYWILCARCCAGYCALAVVLMVEHAVGRAPNDTLVHSSLARHFFFCPRSCRWAVIRAHGHRALQASKLQRLRWHIPYVRTGASTPSALHAHPCCLAVQAYTHTYTHTHTHYTHSLHNHHTLVPSLEHCLAGVAAWPCLGAHRHAAPRFSSLLSGIASRVRMGFMGTDSCLALAYGVRFFLVKPPTHTHTRARAHSPVSSDRLLFYLMCALFLFLDRIVLSSLGCAVGAAKTICVPGIGRDACAAACTLPGCVGFAYGLCSSCDLPGESSTPASCAAQTTPCILYGADGTIGGRQLDANEKYTCYRSTPLNTGASIYVWRTVRTRHVRRAYMTAAQRNTQS